MKRFSPDEARDIKWLLMSYLHSCDTQLSNLNSTTKTKESIELINHLSAHAGRCADGIKSLDYYLEKYGVEQEMMSF